MQPDSREQENRPKVEGVWGKVFAVVFCFFLTESIQRKYLWVPEPLALTISAAFILLPAYWFPPRSEITFLRYAGIIVALIATSAIELSTPDVLRQHIPIQFAVSLPLLVMCLPLYYLSLGLAPDTWRKVGLAKRAAAFLVTAIVLAVAATTEPEAS